MFNLKILNDLTRVKKKSCKRVLQSVSNPFAFVNYVFKNISIHCKNNNTRT